MVCQVLWKEESVFSNPHCPQLTTCDLSFTRGGLERDLNRAGLKVRSLHDVSKKCLSKATNCALELCPGLAAYLNPFALTVAICEVSEGEVGAGEEVLERPYRK